MTDDTKSQTTGYDNIASALSAAQLKMGKALKDSTNPHFRSKYADLGNVMDACMSALNENGIAVIQPPGEDENGRYVETRLIHGESGESLSCRIALIVAKNDMQGFGSAMTYARRYGLMAMAGIAPEDDDGNAAAKAAPRPVATISAEEFIALRDKIEEAGVDPSKVCNAHKAQSLEQFPASEFEAAMKRLNATIVQKQPPKNDTPVDDEIPHQGSNE